LQSAQACREQGGLRESFRGAARRGAAVSVVLFLLARPACADQLYSTNGEDVYRIESSGAVSRIVYTGSERLSVKPEGKQLRFEAAAHYLRDAPDGKSDLNARFVQVLMPDGTFVDRTDEDPDFLTILDQPFAVRLDTATLRDVRELRGRLPFSATSPLGGDTVLRGFLRPGVSGPIDGHQTVAIRFQAEGPMAGPLRGYNGATVSGRMLMDGTAYYALDDATLLALNATLTIDAQLYQGQPPAAVPVQIIYRRSIRATTPTTQPAVRTLLPTPLATGGETAPPPTR
jgi:hypothetical protein